MFAKSFTFFVALLLSTFVTASPQIETWTTQQQTRVLYVHAPEIPMVDVSIVFNAGAARDADKPGLARMTIAMLNEGAGDMDANAIAASFEDVGARFGVSAERDMAVVSLRSITEEKALAQALSTFNKVLTKPSFPADAYARIQRNVLTGLQAENQSPRAIATRSFYTELFKNHPYGVMPQGTVESVSALTVDDLKAFYGEHFVSANAVMAIIGDIDRTQAEEMAESIMAGLPQGKAVSALPEVPALKAEQVIKHDFPSSQTTIYMGQVGMSRHDKDYFALYVGNHVLGGSGLVSVLSDEIREKRGLTYSVYSYFRPMLEAGPYQFVVQTRNEKADETLSVLRQTVKDFIEHGPTQKQIDEAKQNITGSFALRVDSNSKIASYLAVIGFYNLPLDYLDQFNEKINAVTLADVKAAFKERVHPDKMLTVMVGGQAAKTE